MKILFIQKTTNPGGSKESLLATLQLLSGAGHEVSVLCSQEGPLTSRLEELGMPFTIARVPEYRKLADRLRFGRHIGRIADTLPGRDCDWVISNEMWWGPSAAMLAECLGCRSAAVLRDTLGGPAKLKKYDLHRLNRVLCINPVMTGWVNNLSGGRENACSIFNPVTLPGIDAGKLDYWRNITDSWPGVEKVFLTVGSLCKRKNQADAVRTLPYMEALLNEEPGLILAGGGSAEYAVATRKIARKLSLSGKILLPGHVEGVRELLEAADGFLFTSLREGLPRSVIEALMAGVPAFSYPLPGLDAIYGEFYDTFVATEPEPKALAEKTASALKCGDLPSYVSALQDKVKERFSEKQYLSALMSALQ